MGRHPLHGISAPVFPFHLSPFSRLSGQGFQPPHQQFCPQWSDAFLPPLPCLSLCHHPVPCQETWIINLGRAVCFSAGIVQQNMISCICFFRWSWADFSEYACARFWKRSRFMPIGKFRFVEAVRIYRLVAGCRQPLQPAKGLRPLDSLSALGTSLLAHMRQKK